MPATMLINLVLAGAAFAAEPAVVTAPQAVSTSAGLAGAVKTAEFTGIQETQPAAPPTGRAHENDWYDFVIHGFLSQGYIRSTDNNYLVRSAQGSFAFSEMGINLTKGLTDRMTVGTQFFAQAVGDQGRFQVRADWFHLDYRYADWMGFRAGRVKVPFGLYNDVSDIDSARVPVLLPQSVYPLANRNLLLSQSGGELYGFIPLRKWGFLDYRVYGGTIILDPPVTNPAFSVRSLATPYVVGSRVLWEPPVEGLRVGGSVQALRIDADLFFPAVTQAVSVRLPALLWAGSAEYVYGDLELTAEYSRWYVRTTSSRAALFPESNVISERGYLMATYRLSEWFQPGSYFSRLIPNIEKRAGPDSLQNVLAATARFDINRYWLVKLEGHYMWGTAGLTDALNSSTPRSDLADRWGVFLIKTTAYF